VNAEDVPDGPLVVDTDVFSWVTWRRQRYEEFDALIRGHTLAVSFATVGEVRAGAVSADWTAPRRRPLEDRISQHYVVLTATDAVTAKWAEIYARLRGQLKGGGVNDMWIAACALAQPNPPPVVTGNLSDFGRIAAKFSLQLVHPDLPS
jgi:predicted nucleic acid-binding protein